MLVNGLNEAFNDLNYKDSEILPIEQIQSDKLKVKNKTL